MQTEPMMCLPTLSKNIIRGFTASLSVFTQGHWVDLRGLRGYQLICAIFERQEIISQSHCSSSKRLSESESR